MLLEFCCWTRGAANSAIGAPLSSFSSLASWESRHMQRTDPQTTSLQDDTLHFSAEHLAHCPNSPCHHTISGPVGIPMTVPSTGH